jgi:hypothetical protein
VKLRRERRDLQEAKDDLQRKTEQFKDEIRAEERERAEQRAEQEYAAELRASRLQIARIRQEADELRRKAQQGSPQEAGIAANHIWRDYLHDTFPGDDAILVRPGKAGGDVVHTVRDGTGRRCGTITWECKRDARWRDTWLEKLRHDAQRDNAAVAVIVSEKLRDDIEHVAQVNGLWVCDPGAARLIVSALRDIVVQRATYEAANSARTAAGDRLLDYAATGDFAGRLIMALRSLSKLQEQVDIKEQAQQRASAAERKWIRAAAGNLAAIVGDVEGLGVSVPAQLQRQLALPRGKARAAELPPVEA